MISKYFIVSLFSLIPLCKGETVLEVAVSNRPNFEEMVKQSLETIVVVDNLVVKKGVLVEMTLNEVIDELWKSVFEQTGYRVLFWFDKESPFLWMKDGESIVNEVLNTRRSLTVENISLADFLDRILDEYGSVHKIDLSRDGKRGMVFSLGMHLEKIRWLEKAPVPEFILEPVNGKPGGQWLGYFERMVSQNSSIRDFRLIIKSAKGAPEDLLKRRYFLQGGEGFSVGDLIRMFCFATASEFYLNDDGNLVVTIGRYLRDSETESATSGDTKNTRS